ncbi:hypothetical protein MNV49_007460 [Pseudohyphozyma bogoriensis]|nr:hypothetical protein MNV49_007460 [Pseudohyphozyma bogoriensis]
MLASILIASGAVGSGPATGFTYYKNPGPFSSGVAGVFKLLVPYNDPHLLTGASKAVRAPLTIAFTRVGYPVVGHVVSAVCILCNISAINGSLYIGSRSLASMATSRYAPAILARTTKRGVPFLAMLATNIFCLLVFTNVSSGASVLYSWIVNLAGVSSFLAWMGIMLCHLRFRKALRLQNIPLSTLPFRTITYPIGTWTGFIALVVLTLIQGWTSFLNPFSIIDFLQAYILLPVFLVFLFGYWAYHRDGFVDLAACDLQTGHVERSEAEIASVMKEDYEGATGSKRRLARAWEWIVG